MDTKHKTKTLIDLEKLNTLNPEGCPACGKNFELGEAVALACGNWEGECYIHEDEAIFEKNTKSYYEQSYHKAMKGKLN
jgi:hypothetical protein